MRHLFTITALVVLCLSTVVESDQSGRQKTVQTKSPDQNNPCNQAIIKFQGQARSVTDGARNFAAKRSAVRKTDRSNPAVLKARLVELEKGSESWRMSTEQFQSTWRQVRRECPTTPTNQQLLAGKLSALKDTLATALEVLGGNDASESDNPGQPQTSCGNCYAPWQQHCDIEQCLQCCKTCPPEPWPICPSLCTSSFNMCTLAGIIKVIDEMSRNAAHKTGN